jgi:hypothetical protein
MALRLPLLSRKANRSELLIYGLGLCLQFESEPRLEPACYELRMISLEYRANPFIGGQWGPIQDCLTVSHHVQQIRITVRPVHCR